MLQILPDLTLAIQIILFLFFIWIMNVILFRPTLKVLEADLGARIRPPHPAAALP